MRASDLAVAVMLVASLLRPAAVAAQCVASPLGPGAPTALVFSGGGAKGAYEAGVAVALVERGVAVRVAAGSSAGALNATAVADGRLDRLEALWRSVSREQVYALRPGVLFAGLLPGWLTLLALDEAGSLLDARPLRSLIAGVVDLDRVRASPVALRVVATDLERRMARVFDNRTVTVDALVAASAVPGLFSPVTVEGAVLVDGGVVARAPVLEALDGRVPLTRVLVVQSYAAAERGQPPTTLRGLLEEAFETAMVHQIRRDVELARLKHPAVEVQLLAPTSPLLLRPLDFDGPALGRAFEQGRADALACVGRWGGGEAR
ncbi:MAG TPA: patatin-like phospholipase family protein [Methylomirabilota bacterium]|nr:patatin-like phospholipase family protein [Methylomirabilota bacterium]